jgi:SAM-dependent methyltransferase
MEDYDASTYGERVAEVYDEQHRYLDEGGVELLAELARGGRALELGIGTGRLALPLAARGVEVHGIDASPAMIERLRAKPGGGAVNITFGDFADVSAEGEFALVYVVFNTFFALLSQDEQARCFQNVAEHLTPDGLFLIEAFVPDLSLYYHGHMFRAASIKTDSLTLNVASLDPVTQTATGQQVIIDERGVRLFPVKLRYAWPSELDLMARLAGLRLRARWGGWRREPFTARSEKHVSVYERAT